MRCGRRVVRLGGGVLPGVGGAGGDNSRLPHVTAAPAAQTLRSCSRCSAQPPAACPPARLDARAPPHLLRTVADAPRSSSSRTTWGFGGNVHGGRCVGAPRRQQAALAHLLGGAGSRHARQGRPSWQDTGPSAAAASAAPTSVWPLRHAQCSGVLPSLFLALGDCGMFEGSEGRLRPRRATPRACCKPRSPWACGAHANSWSSP